MPRREGQLSLGAFLMFTGHHVTALPLYLRIAGARGHRQLVGTASQIADQLHNHLGLRRPRGRFVSQAEAAE
jgi:hypothetical protein